MDIIIFDAIKEYKVMLKEKRDIEQSQVTSSESVERYARKMFKDDDIHVEENTFVIMLDRELKVLGHIHLGKGIVSAALIDKHKLILAIGQLRASSVILVHNHPSGQLKPSQADKKVTADIKEMLKLLEVKVLDHVILTPDEGEYYSFADHGIL